MPTEGACYRFGPWTVDSGFRVDLRTSDQPPDWRITSAGMKLRQRHVKWYDRIYTAAGTPWLWLGRDDDEDVLRFPGWGWCRIRMGQRQIACSWDRQLGADAIDHLLVNHVLPQTCAAAGFLVFHASVVQRPSGGAVAFIGPAGTGKSTTAAFLASRGWRVMSDDRLIVDQAFNAYPLVPYLRVTAAVAAWLGFRAALPEGHHKVRIRLAGQGSSYLWAEQAAPLEQIVFLERGAGVTALEPVAGPQAVLSLLNAQLQPGMNRPDVRRRVFEGVTALPRAVACVKLRTPAGVSELERVPELLL